jgi:serine/threonine protein kinase
MAKSAPQLVDRATFLANLRQSGLLDGDVLADAVARLPETDRGRLVARALVERGVLTKFQAERLLAGLTAGFVLGQYVILDQLGQGGMGRVFKARHRTMNRIVALKILAPHLLRTDKANQLFQREVRAVARLIHPNIVTAFDANQAGDRSYLVLEYVDGPNLEQLVQERGPLPVGQACDFIRQVALGLQCAFEMGMVHRDIKPANLLVAAPSHRPAAITQPEADGRPPTAVIKISDFGIARLQADADEGNNAGTIVSTPNTVMGTPDYLSPEQARDLHKADIRSDLYSLGCTFYFLLTGQVPFPGGTMLEKLVRQTTETPTPVEQMRPALPAPVVDIVRRLLAKNPAERFQTPTELALAVAPYAVGSPAEWTTRPGTFVDPGASPFSVTPLPGFVFEPAGAEEDAVLVGTLPPGLSPTAVSAVGMTSASHLARVAAHEQKRRLRTALAWTAGILAALAAIASAVAWLM